MANKKFLEEYPLYKKFSPGWQKFTPFYDHTHIRNNQLPKPAIHMWCEVCKSEQTFNMSNEYYDQHIPSTSKESVHGTVKEIRYVCSACDKGLIVFLVYFGYVDKGHDKQTEMYLEKVGQIPAWSIKMDAELESILGQHAEYYKKGLICESQGYGIGAFSYFRRITEDIIDELLNSVEELLSGEEKIKYHEALVEVKKTRVTQEKIDLVKDLLPDSLRPNGVNPLSALHSALSEGLHAEGDEECLEYADAIKNTLIFLVNRLVRTKTENLGFSESMKKLLEKKAGLKKVTNSEELQDIV